MVLGDRRFQKKRNQLPKWISQELTDSLSGLSTDVAVTYAKKFLKDMAQPFGQKEQDGLSMWSIKDLEEHVEKMHSAKIRELQNAQTNGDQKMNDVNGGVDGHQNGNDEEYGDDDEMDAVMRDMDA